MTERTSAWETGWQAADLDPLAMAVSRARTERALFGHAEPPRIGRYNLHGVIGGGGMGMVYSGFDPDLQRKVALKVLLPARSADGRARERLVREARALARLDHRNVVQVHDVLDHLGQVVIVMELIEGVTLDRWVAAAPRTLRAIVDVFAQAAEGLAAAHAEGIVHRDFKPSNAIIGDDGRVRVLDFGLAQAATGPVDPGAVITPLDLTTTGDVVGTPAFAAPEQLAGAAVTAASDQFSFCVALHQALEAVSPFGGRDVGARLASIRAGAIAHGDRPLPPWLRAALARGLAFTAGDRFPAMTDLLAELRRPRGWRRWRLPMLATVLIAASAGMTLFAQGTTSRELCDSPLDAEIWNVASRARLIAGVRSAGTPYAQETADRAAAALEAYRDHWRSEQRMACLAHHRGEISTPLYDRQVACLTERLRDVRTAVAVATATERSSVTNVMDVVVGLPSPSTCGRDRVLAEAEVPPTPALQLQVAHIRAEIRVGVSTAAAGRSEFALTVLDAAARQAAAVAYPPLTIEAGLAVGRVSLATGNYDRAREALLPVRREAFASRHDEPAIEASARLLYIAGMTKPDSAGLERELGYVLPLSERLGRDSVARILLLNNIGAAYQAASRRDDAYHYFSLAKAELHSENASVPELTCVDRNLAMLTRDPVAREALVRHVWLQLRDTFGPAHPTTIDAQVAYGQYALAPEVALQQLDLAVRAYRQFHPTLVLPRAFAELRRASLASDLGRDEIAGEAYRAVLDLTAGDPDPDAARWHALAQGEAAILAADPAAAIAALAPVLALRTSPQWWERADALRALVRLGEAELLRGHDERAVGYLEAAVGAYDAIVARNEDVEYPRLRAHAKRLLAQILARRGESARAAALSRDAHDFYRSSSPAAYARWLIE